MGFVAFFAVWASAIDAKRRILPNKLLAAMCISALLCLLLRSLGAPWLAHFPWLAALSASLPAPGACVLQAVAVTASLALFEVAYRRLAKRAGIGFGDIKLLACWTLALGIWSLYAMALSCATGAIWGLVNRERTFPLGPFITFWSIAIALSALPML